MCCSDIQKSNLIRTLLIITSSNLYRVACIADINKLHAFYNATIINIQTRDNSFC